MNRSPQGPRPLGSTNPRIVTLKRYPTATVSLDDGFQRSTPGETVRIEPLGEVMEPRVPAGNVTSTYDTVPPLVAVERYCRPCYPSGRASAKTCTPAVTASAAGAAANPARTSSKPTTLVPMLRRIIPTPLLLLRGLGSDWDEQRKLCMHVRRLSGDCQKLSKKWQRNGQGA